MTKPKSKSISQVAKAYKRSTKKVAKRVSYTGTFGQNQRMDSRALATGAKLKSGDTYAFTGVAYSRIPKGKGKPMGMTYGTDRKGVPGTKKIKRARP
jgi:hypothetical protein